MKDKKYIERIILYSNKILKYIKDVKYDDFILDDEKADVSPFIKDLSVLNIWSSNFFRDITLNIKAI